MVLFVRKGYNGEDQEFYIDGYKKKILDNAVMRNKKNWDYVALYAGIPGSGKSTLARTDAKYCCPWFDIKYIAFTAQEFIRITNTCPDYSSVVLDESFQSLNSKITMSKPFQRIINHLQLIRQKRLFVFLSAIALLLTMSSLTMAQKAKVGETAPDFKLLDSSSKEHELSDFKDKYVVLEWVNFGCPFVQKHYKSGNMQKLQKNI